MKKTRCGHEPHLAIKRFSLPPGGEWVPQPATWALIQINEGTGYCLHPDLNQQLEAGAVVVTAAGAQATIRASHLGYLSLHSFNVAPNRLGGVLSLTEQSFFQTAASRKEFSFQVLPPSNPVATKMKEVCASASGASLLCRLKLLEVFAEVFGNEPDQSASSGTVVDAWERLRMLLKETPSSELLEMSFGDLAQRTHCTSRHLNRIFRVMVGKSFREKRTELRLARSLELLATSDSKILDVALESGYKSLSLFNLMFSRRFGTSPGRWRHKYAGPRNKGKKRAMGLATDGMAD